MCTIVALKGQSPHFPLIVAANRDEYYAREATPPRVIHDAPRAIAGVDLEKGGTWFGANERGLFVAITNQRTYRRGDPRPLSRGRVVHDALALNDVPAIDAFVESLDPRAYNAFNLMYGDAARLRVAYARHEHERIEIVPLEDGAWALTNDRLGSPEFPKSERALTLTMPHASAPWDELWPALARALGDHEKPSIESLPEPPPRSMFGRELLRELQAICIHTAVYGTRSATILAIEPGRVAHYLFANGAPCTTPFTDVTALLGA